MVAVLFRRITMLFLKGGLFGIGIFFLLLLGVLVIGVLPLTIFFFIAQYSIILAIAIFALAAAFILGGVKMTESIPGPG